MPKTQDALAKRMCARHTAATIFILVLTTPFQVSAQGDFSTRNDNAAKAKQLLHRAQSAMGGVSRIEAVKNVTQIWKISSETPQGRMKVKQKTRWISPGYFRQTMDMPAGRMDIYYDGNSGWYSTPERALTVIPSEVASQVRDVIFRTPYTLLLSDRMANRRMTVVADSAVEISDESNRTVRVHFDPSSGLPVRYVFFAAAQTGESVTTTETFSDFHSVSGVMVPRRMILEQNGRKLGDIEIETIVNSGLSLSTLAAKPF